MSEMARILTSMVVATVIAGCGASRQAEPTSPDDAVASPSADAAGDPSASVASDATPGVAPAGPPCEQEIARECGEGLTDGCLIQTDEGAPLTTVHVCVPADASAAPPCEQEIARECGAGLSDACLMTPPPSTMHVCVATP